MGREKENRKGGEEAAPTQERGGLVPLVHPCHQVLVGKDREVAHLGFAQLRF